MSAEIDEDYPLATHVRVGRRGRRGGEQRPGKPPISPQSTSKAFREASLGGDVVQSMKRGIRSSSRQGTALRRQILWVIALLLFVALTITWTYRLHARTQAVGGWKQLFALVKDRSSRQAIRGNDLAEPARRRLPESEL